MNRRRFILAAGAISGGTALGQSIFVPGRRLVTPSAGGFRYSGTYFDGTNDYMQISELTGVADSKLFLFTCWFKLAAVSTWQYLFSNRTTGTFSCYVRYNGTNSNKEMDVALRNASNTNVMRYIGPTNQINDTNWHFFGISVDLANSSNRRCYLDGTKQSDSGFTTFTNDSVNFDPADNKTYQVGVFGTDATKRWAGDMCQLYMATPGSYFDLETNLTYFRTSDGHPANMITAGAPSPLVYLKNDYSTFGTNSGTGGNFTVTGTLENSSTTP